MAELRPNEKPGGSEAYSHSDEYKGNCPTCASSRPWVKLPTPEHHRGCCPDSFHRGEDHYANVYDAVYAALDHESLESVEDAVGDAIEAWEGHQG